MAIITRPPANIPRKAVTVRMPLPVADTLYEYASFIGSSLDHVVIEALKLVFKKDSEFKAWQNQTLSQPSAGRASAEPAPAPSELLFEAAKVNRRRGAPNEEP